MTEAGGVGLLPALWRLRIAWVRLTLLARSRLPVSSAAAQREAPGVSDIGLDTPGGGGGGRLLPRRTSQA